MRALPQWAGMGSGRFVGLMANTLKERTWIVQKAQEAPPHPAAQQHTPGAPAARGPVDTSASRIKGPQKAPAA